MSERAKVLAGNWKMNFGPAEALDYFAALGREVRDGEPAPGVRRVVFPPAYCLGPDMQHAASRIHVELGAQNVHWEEKGAFTGELSAPELKKAGINWALVGHSERRQIFGETDQTAASRFKKAAETGLNVVFCIGESLQERESGRTEAILARQLKPFLQTFFSLTPSGPCLWCLAYEPVWAIGTGRTATTEQAEEAHKYIRRVVWDELGMEAAQRIPILYGGSVTPENCGALMAQPNVDGVLVGGASLKPNDFARILATK